VLLVIAFISMLFPNHLRFKYQFEQGKIWAYEDLYAPFDIAIKKSASEIRAERQRRENDFSPYYKVAQDALEDRQKAFEAAFNVELKKEIQAGTTFVEIIQKPNLYIQQGKKLLQKIYEKGIIQLANIHQNKGDEFVINIVRGNTTQTQTLGNLQDPEDVEMVLGNPSMYGRLREPEFLFPILETIVQPNILYSPELTERFKNEYFSTIPSTKGLVQKGERIVTKGADITDEIYEKLLSYRAQYEEEVTKNRSGKSIFGGYFLLTTLIVGVFLLYLQRYHTTYFSHLNKFVFVLIWLVIYGYLVYIINNVNAVSAYLIPFCIVPIVIKHFANSQLALFTHVIVILIASFLSSLGYEFTFMQIIVGIVAILGNVDSRNLSEFFRSIVFIFLAYVTTFVGLSLVQEGNIYAIDTRIILWLFVNVFLTLLAYPLIPILERLFGFTSTSSLIELSDMNKPLLKELSLKAPGTLQHSLQVGNLCEAAATDIGANALLVKVAALYHDIGKISHPQYYIENQKGENPHDTLSSLDSGKMITAHVTEGIKLAKKYRLPRKIVDFIKSHHGTTRVEYFYRQHIKDHPERTADEVFFRYPGPRPTTKEQTIMMIADSVEAACKSLKSPTGQDIDQMVDRIITGKLTSGQLEESELSFADLEKCRVRWKALLRNIHHVRVEYPEEETATKSISADSD
ncbi:MAG: HDIG domain-containing metalloprotein, partial [Bacteroidota bacterium]